ILNSLLNDSFGKKVSWESIIRDFDQGLYNKPKELINISFLPEYLSFWSIDPDRTLGRLDNIIHRNKLGNFEPKIIQFIKKIADNYISNYSIAEREREKFNTIEEGLKNYNNFNNEDYQVMEEASRAYKEIYELVDQRIIIPENRNEMAVYISSFID